MRRESSADIEADRGTKVLAEAFRTRYGFGRPVRRGWSAVCLGSDLYRVKNPEGASRTMEVGQRFRDGTHLERSDWGHLVAGGEVILVGEHLDAGWEAHPTRGGYTIVPPRGEGRPQKVVPGESAEGLGEVRLEGVPDGDGEILVVGERRMAVYPLESRLNLLVLDTDPWFEFRPGAREQNETPRPAFFGLSTDESERRNGIPGLFFPASGSRAATFKEIDANGRTLAVARFLPAKGGRGLDALIRPLSVALEERALRAELYRRERERRARTNANPAAANDRAEQALRERIDAYMDVYWNYERMHVAAGMECFSRLDSTSEPAARSRARGERAVAEPAP